MKVHHIEVLGVLLDRQGHAIGDPISITLTYKPSGHVSNSCQITFPPPNIKAEIAGLRITMPGGIPDIDWSD